MEDRELQQVTEEVMLSWIKGAKVEALEIRDTSMRVYLGNGWLIGCEIKDGKVRPICKDALYERSNGKKD